MKILVFISFIILFGESCAKKLGKVSTPDFTVSVQKNTFKTGEPVVFTFTGNADNISFYSGAIFNDYTYKDSARIIDVSSFNVLFSFSSQLVQPDTSSKQQNQVSVWLSTDYNGIDSFPDIKKANWTDITGSFSLATTADEKPSDTADISQYFSAEKPVFIGFKYITRLQKEHGLASTWTIRNFSVLSAAPYVGNKPVAIATQENSGLRIINQYPKDAPSRSVVAPNLLTLLGNVYKTPVDNGNTPGGPWDDVATETWAITRPLYKNKVSLDPDKSISIKGPNTDAVGSYTYSYAEPGKYKVYFVAQNSNITEQQATVKELTLTITP